MKPFKGFRRCANWLLLLAMTVGERLAAQTANAPGNAHPLWQVHGSSNSVYLFGSIHFAKEDFYPLAKPIEQAYQRASTVVFEANPGEMKSMETQTKLLKAGMCPAGETLSQHVSKETYAGLQSWLKNAVGVPSPLDQMKPWLASVSVVALQLQKLGFNPNQGIDEHYYSRAKTDKKEIRALDRKSTRLNSSHGYISYAVF